MIVLHHRELSGRTVKLESRDVGDTELLFGHDIISGSVYKVASSCTYDQALETIVRYLEKTKSCIGDEIAIEKLQSAIRWKGRKVYNISVKKS